MLQLAALLVHLEHQELALQELALQELALQELALQQRLLPPAYGLDLDCLDPDPAKSNIGAVWSWLGLYLPY